MVWQKDFKYDIQKHLSGVDSGVRIDNKKDDDDEESKNEITLDDCFNEFRKPELLDEDNKWYCNKCKEHVQATKQLGVYRVPPIIVISLKRFKQSKSNKSYLGMFGGSSHGQKLDCQVDFPLEGLDLSKYVIGAQKTSEKLIYDCYAVSNHYGNMGFGHYTAYAKNPITDKWYDFDDSRIQQLRPDQVKNTVVTNAAYNLFYRRRDWHEKNIKEGINFDEIAVKPDMSYI